jgi:hypothetical protein
MCGAIFADVFLLNLILIVFIVAHCTLTSRPNPHFWLWPSDGVGGIPTEQRFWEDLIENSTDWGLAVYEQDWLYNEFQSLNATRENITLGRYVALHSALARMHTRTRTHARAHAHTQPLPHLPHPLPPSSSSTLCTPPTAYPSYRIPLLQRLANADGRRCRQVQRDYPILHVPSPVYTPDN